MMKQKKNKNSFSKNVSAEHRLYLLNEKKNKLFVLLWQIFIFISFFALWEIAARFGWIDSFFVSSPSRIFFTICDLIGGSLMSHVGISLLECLIGFAISTILGTLIAILLWLSVMSQKVFKPYLIVLNALPKVALGPLIIIWVGIGMPAIVVMAVLICIIVTVITVLDGLVATDENKLFLLRSMGGTKLQQLRYVVLPSSLPTIMSIIKVNIGLSWVGTIMGEYLVSSAGLGYLIVYGGQVFKIDLVMASTVVLCLLAALMYGAVALIEKLIIKQRDRKSVV